LLSLIFEPGILAYRKTSPIRDCHGSVNVFGALELFLYPASALTAAKKAVSCSSDIVCDFIDIKSFA
jgi:hypothetical protein